MGQRRTLGCLAAVLLLGCFLPASALCAATNIGTYYLLRKPVTIRDPVQIGLEMDRIGGEVRALRGITDAAPVKRALITPDQLREKMTGDFQKDYSPEKVRDDLEEYTAFGVVDPKYDLYSLYRDTYTKYVLGYYNPAEKELYVVSGAGFGASERSTFAHEYMHGLQFQKEGLSPDTWANGENSEVVAGIRALVEGEAVFVEYMWEKRYFSFGDQIDYYKQSVGQLDAEYFRIPLFLQRMIYFPYLEGRAFVAYLYQEGGWAAVEKAYRNPPTSTEMILHPEKYLQRDLPVGVAKPLLPATLSDGWHEIHDDVMGEFSTDLILATQMNTLRASQAAAGWGGDRYLVARNDATGSTAVVWHTRWDTPADADDFASALREYDTGRFGASETGTGAVCWTAIVAACQSQSGTDVWWFYGPDGKTVQTLMESNLPTAAGSLSTVPSSSSIRSIPSIL